MIRFGYACINETLRSAKPSIYTGRSCTRKTFDSRGLTHVSKLIARNVSDLIDIVRWNVEHDVHVFRISSSMCSWASEYALNDLPDIDDIESSLNEVGNVAKAGDVRLSFHPGQFNVLASANERVVDNTIKDLELHGRLMDMMMQPRSPAAKINVHIGGTYGDKPAALTRFCRNFERLDESVRPRLTIENDDKANCYSVEDLMWVHERIGTPIVFDYHHHKFCPGTLSERDALHVAAATWPVDVRPVTHYAESRDPEVMTPAHSDWIVGPIHDHGLDIDCILECKKKELALLKFRTSVQS